MALAHAAPYLPATMTDRTDGELDSAPSRAIPHGRSARLGQFGKLAGGVAGGMLAEGARQLASGKRPRLRDLMLTPANANRLADRLSHLRGAAMKLGQMISMDAGDMLPDELSSILAKLRDNAHRMPPKQLQQVLDSEWGEGWRKQFKLFDPRPIAAASIGQVHRAQTRDGRDLAIKVQYPGVRESIDADVDNVATLLRISNLLPSELDITPLLEEAKRQLNEEADYKREAQHLAAYALLLEGEKDFIVPALHADLSTTRVLAMEFVAGRPIETLADAPQEMRDTTMTRLIELVLRELFDFGLMQTDPNFANYRIQPETGRLVLLDFGAAREVSGRVADAYRALLQAGLAADRDAIRAAAVEAGFISDAATQRHRESVNRMIEVIVAEMNRPGAFDFGDRAFVASLRDEGLSIAEDRQSWHIPPADILLAQRKISGTALLAARLKAKVDVRGMTERMLQERASV